MGPGVRVEVKCVERLEQTTTAKFRWVVCKVPRADRPGADRIAWRRRVRILWLGHFVPWPPKGGSLIRSYHLLREASLGNEVALVCLNQRSLLPTAERLDEARRELASYLRVRRHRPDSGRRTAPREGANPVVEHAPGAHL